PNTDVKIPDAVMTTDASFDAAAVPQPDKICVPAGSDATLNHFSMLHALLPDGSPVSDSETRWLLAAANVTAVLLSSMPPATPNVGLLTYVPLACALAS